MAGFVLIHGSWFGGWSFDGVAERLRADGHMVSAPTLPGMGGDAAELRAVTLAGWADFALAECRALRAAGCEQVLLAGHSRGGLVVSTAAERDPAAMDAIAYICAVMLPDGMSRADYAAIEPRNPDFAAIISPLPHGAGTVADPVNGPAVFAQVSPPELVAAAMARLLAEPLSVRTEKLALTAERFGSVPRTYIECTLDRTIPLESQRRMQGLVPGARVVTLEADHSPFLSAPDELVGALEGALNVG